MALTLFPSPVLLLHCNVTYTSEGMPNKSDFLKQGPFDTFLVGGDTAEVSGMKFSYDGKLMLLSTSNGHVYVVDAYTGRKVCTLIMMAVH